MNKTEYDKQLSVLHVELAKLEYWVRSSNARVVVLFEGRDAAGKGGTISAIQSGMNPRTVRTVALPAPSPRQATQWYFQRYVEQLPAGGEMVLFDRSWYNRAGVEPVMGFCTTDQHTRFLKDAPRFEEMLIDDGVLLRKYYLAVSREEQHRRFVARSEDPTKRWKVSPVDLAAVDRFDAYSDAEQQMFQATHSELSPWYIVNSDDKRRARIDVTAHLLSTLPYNDAEPPSAAIPPLPLDPEPTPYAPPIEPIPVPRANIFKS
jgi:polyphosphate kinase 2